MVRVTNCLSLTSSPLSHPLTRMVLTPMPKDAQCSHRRQSHRKDGPAAFSIRRRECAAMFRDHTMRQRQSDAVPFRFGGEERNEDLLQILGRYARARVLDRDRYPAIIWLDLLGRIDNYTAVGGIIPNCFHRVANQIQESLAKESGIGADRRF